MPVPEPTLPYHRLMRGSVTRWWRVPLSLVVLVAVLVLFAAGVETVGNLTRRDGADESARELVLFNLVSVGGIVAAMAATWIGLGRRPGWLSSIAGRLRWPWLILAVLTAAIGWIMGLMTVVLILLPSGVGSGVGTDDSGSTAAAPNWSILLAVVLLTTPLQAAAEEYVFRGWLPQLIGAVVPNASVSLVAGMIVPSLLFAAAHGQQDLWLFADRFMLGLLAAVLVWCTGGLEAAIALHTVNNLAVFIAAIANDAVDETRAPTQSAWTSLVFSLFPRVSVVVLVVLAAWFSRLQRVRLSPPSDAAGSTRPLPTTAAAPRATVPWETAPRSSVLRPSAPWASAPPASVPSTSASVPAGPPVMPVTPPVPLPAYLTPRPAVRATSSPAPAAPEPATPEPATPEPAWPPQPSPVAVGSRPR